MHVRAVRDVANLSQHVVRRWCLDLELCSVSHGDRWADWAKLPVLVATSRLMTSSSCRIIRTFRTFETL
jgi:hypothetical protein